MATEPGINMEAKIDARENPFESYLDALNKMLEDQDPIFMIGIVVSLAVVVITVVLLKYLLSRKTVQSAVLLVGLCDSGKTLLFSRLLSGKFKKTQTSIMDSSAPYKAKNERVRRKLAVVSELEETPSHLVFCFLADCRAMVFVVDSAIFQKEVRDVAEFLYFLLTDSVVSRNVPSLIVACNKQDITMAKYAKLMNTLRVTRSVALSAQDGSAGASVHLGKKGKDFEFSQLPMKVEFLECSARGSKGEDGEADIASLEKSLALL
uniref:signal recognition particle receptor subunit beta-like n=1 Tax=Oncorhynchus gorbuscha TaxID=8017 RepID=UPI001EAE99FE|nr:signal recognition particle receptor subunit beta-like [Oncorhynchus gorbuscha]